jgi:hypothetical protein
MTRRLLPLSMAFGIACCLILMAVRLGSMVVHGPFSLVATSGAEEEAVLGIWRASQGVVYTDPLKVPFTASYYNWLFFEAYGWVAGHLAALVPQVPEAFPTFGRLFTLAGLAVGLAAFCLAAQSWRGRALGLGLFIAFGPLVGWWAVALHPEVWASTMTLVAAAIMVRLYPAVPLGAVVLASLASLAAWSFKQSYVYGALAMGLALLSLKDWRGLAVAVGIHLAGVGLALGLGSEVYRRSMMLAGASGLAPAVFLQVMINGLAKCGVLLPAGLAAVMERGRRANVMADMGGRFVLALIAASLLGVAATAKLGASESYYFPLAASLALLAARGGGPSSSKPLELAQSLAWLGHGVFCLLVLTGVAGTVSVAYKDTRYRAQRECVRDLPSPFWADDSYLSLPWMHPQGPHFIAASDYQRYREAGQAFEKDGIGGMIRAQAFPALTITSGVQVPIVDGVSVEETYRLAQFNCAGIDIYVPR